MKPAAKYAILIALVAAAAAGAGYWAGQRGGGQPAGAAAEAGSTANAGRKVLYYRNPMGLPDTSPVPKKDPMGMDYLPVYEGGDAAAPAAGREIVISTAKVQKLGVRTEKAGARPLGKAVRAAGRVEPDERRTWVISPKFEGYIERLHVSATGQEVGKGQPLFEVYSPELVSAQREYAVAAQGVAALAGAGSEARDGMRQLADASLARLRNWDISAAQVRALANGGPARRTMTFRSPATGIVTEKKAVQGMRFMPGDVLFQVTDLSSVWVLADVNEQDIGMLATGTEAQVGIGAYPGRVFAGKVTYIYPTLDTGTRTAQVRIELPNPGRLLKPGMFASVTLAVSSRASAVTVPVSAVIDSGTRQTVLVQLAEGRFDPREVTLGARSDDYVEVLEGVAAGENVVVAANFLIDAESNLKAATASFGDTASAQQSAPVGHHAEGTVESVDAAAGTASIDHGPVASLNWPAMTMEFGVANKALLAHLKPGARVRVEFVERKPDEWVITSVRPAGAGR